MRLVRRLFNKVRWTPKRGSSRGRIRDKREGQTPRMTNPAGLLLKRSFTVCPCGKNGKNSLQAESTLALVGWFTLRRVRMPAGTRPFFDIVNRFDETFDTPFSPCNLSPKLPLVPAPWRLVTSPNVFAHDQPFRSKWQAYNHIDEPTT